MIISLSSLREFSTVHSGDVVLAVVTVVSEVLVLADLCNNEGSSLPNESMVSISTSSDDVDSASLLTSLELLFGTDISYNSRYIFK